jgi:hypothetical protein
MDSRIKKFRSMKINGKVMLKNIREQSDSINDEFKRNPVNFGRIQHNSNFSTVRHRSIDSKENPLSAFKNLVDIKPTYKSKYLKDSFKIRSNDVHTLKKPLLASIDPTEAVTSKNKTLNSSINRNQTL